MTIDQIAADMAQQDNRGTQYPLYVVQSQVKDYNDDGCSTERKEEAAYEDHCKICQATIDLGDDLPDYCEHCGDAVFARFDWTYAFDLRGGVFFTADACARHILQNAHHYQNPRSYVIPAWRNPEMVQVMQLVLVYGGQKLPAHYE